MSIKQWFESKTRYLTVTDWICFGIALLNVLAGVVLGGYCLYHLAVAIVG